MPESIPDHFITDFRTFCVILLLLFMYNPVFCQNPSRDIHSIRTHLETSLTGKAPDVTSQDYCAIQHCVPGSHAKDPESRSKATRNRPALLHRYNPLKLLLDGSLWTYQRYISPQLGNRCIYHPSCSRFARQIIEENGLADGILLTADRLSRCNRLAMTDTPFSRIDPDLRRIKDESERYAR